MVVQIVSQSSLEGFSLNATVFCDTWLKAVYNPLNLVFVVYFNVHHFTFELFRVPLFLLKDIPYMGRKLK